MTRGFVMPKSKTRTYRPPGAGWFIIAGVFVSVYVGDYFLTGIAISLLGEIDSTGGRSLYAAMKAMLGAVLGYAVWWCIRYSGRKYWIE